MILKSYLEFNNISIASLQKKTGIPYTTIYEIVNGKVEIDRVYVGTALKLAQACDVSFPKFCDMCRETTSLPPIEGGDLVIINKNYYLIYDMNGNKERVFLSKAGIQNKRIAKKIAEQKIDEIASTK